MSTSMVRMTANIPDTFSYSFLFSFNHILPSQGPFALHVTTHYFSKVRIEFLAHGEALP